MAKLTFARLSGTTESICRYFISLLMFIYGLVKVFQAQFYTDFYWKDLPLGSLSGMQLTWSFYGYSPWYESIIGITEVLIAFLLLFNRTKKLAVLLFVPLMANLVLINIIYEIGALGSAYPLLAAGLILLFKYRNDYHSLTRPTPPEKQRTWKFQSAVKLVILLTGFSIAGLIIYNNKYRIKQDNRIRGAWEVVSPKGMYNKIYFEKGNTCIVLDAENKLHFLNYQTAGNIQLNITGESIPESLRKASGIPYSITNGALTLRGRETLILRRTGRK